MAWSKYSEESKPNVTIKKTWQFCDNEEKNCTCPLRLLPQTAEKLHIRFWLHFPNVLCTLPLCNAKKALFRPCYWLCKHKCCCKWPRVMIKNHKCQKQDLLCKSTEPYHKNCNILHFIFLCLTPKSFWTFVPVLDRLIVDNPSVVVCGSLLLQLLYFFNITYIYESVGFVGECHSGSFLSHHLFTSVIAAHPKNNLHNPNFSFNQHVKKKPASKYEKLRLLFWNGTVLTKLKRPGQKHVLLHEDYFL